MSPPISLDLISSCRLCLSQEGLLPLFPDTESQEDIFISMPKRIMTCVAIEVSQEDNFPKNICEVCKKSIDDWEKFKEQCDRVNSTLHQIVDSQTTAEYVEKLRNNLGGAPSALLFSDVDGSLFERESLFGTLDDSSQVDGTDVLNISLSDELLSENRVQPINASNLLSDELGGNQSITSDLLPDKIICGNSQSSPNLLLSDGIPLENPKSSLTSSNLLMADKVRCESPWLHSASNVSSSNLFESTGIEYLLKTDENPDVGNRNISNQIEGLTECGDRDGNNQYSCELCENSFSDFTKLLEHDDIDHNTLLKNFSCEVCNKMFVSENRIALHTCEVDCNGQVVETSRERFPCEFCDKDFIYFSRLLCHDDSHHADIPRHFSCQECGDEFLSENRVNMHMRSRHRLGKNVERFPCGLCKRDFITFNRLLNHDDSHHRQIPRESGCQECGEQFISERRLNMHMRRRHKNGKRDKKPYPCGFCEEVFSKFTSLLKHDDTQHAKLPRNVRCQVCGKMFLSESRIDVHKRIHEERKFQCETCNKSFLSSKCLLVHVRIHSNKFVCNFCGVKKQSLRMLEDHVRVHTGEKLFACQLCGKTFSTKHGKEKHENILHKDRKNFKCDVCDYRSYCSSRLNIHKQTHNIHKKFKCEHCDKLFQTKSTYLHHIKLHTNSNKSYKCLVCSAVFRLKCDLTRHEASHLNLRPYSCYICDKSYNRKDLLKAHIRLHITKKSHSCEKCKRSFKTIKYLKRHKCTAEQEIVVESEGESQENELSNHEMNMDYSDATNIVELGETILNNVDDTVEVTSALDNFEQSPENLNNNVLILNDGNLMLINPSVACEVNNSAPLSFYLL